VVAHAVPDRRQHHDTLDARRDGEREVVGDHGVDAEGQVIAVAFAGADREDRLVEAGGQQIGRVQFLEANSLAHTRILRPRSYRRPPRTAISDSPSALPFPRACAPVGLQRLTARSASKRLGQQQAQ
jgi:hypothetical protein